MLADNTSDNLDLNILVLHHLNPDIVIGSKVAMTAMGKVLKATYGTSAYLALIRQYKLKGENPGLLHLALARYKEPEGAEAVRLLIESGDKNVLHTKLTGSNGDTLTRMLTVLGMVGYTETLDLMQEVLLSGKYSKPVRMKAADMLGKTYGGEDRAVELLRDKQVPKEYIPAVVGGLKGGLRSGMYKKAQTYLPGSSSQNDDKPAPTIASLLSLKGDANNGAVLFQSACQLCHQVRDKGNDFGPKLSGIGSKLPPEALFKSLISPSSAISFNYQTSLATLKSGTAVTGIISSQTATDLAIKFPGGSMQNIKIVDIKNIKELPESLMPAFYETKSNQELADIVKYLTTLTQK